MKFDASLVLLILFITGILTKPLPVVLWHGMGDSCCSGGMKNLKNIIQEHVNGTYVYSVMIGSNEVEDRTSSFMGNVNDQIEFVCKKLAEDPNLKDGFNAIGISQGSQFLRGYVQRCNNPPVHTLISIGGQHQGVYGFPRCLGENSTLCDLARKMLRYGAYMHFVQSRLVQAQYFHDPLSESNYLNYCIFLPDINNAKPIKNETYKNNLKKLKKFVMVKFSEDSMVQPSESQWFGFYKYGQSQEVLPLRETQLYKEDWLGLKEMDEKGKLDFLTVEGDHLQFTKEWFINTIIPYLRK